MLKTFASVVLPAAGGPQTITSGVIRRDVNDLGLGTLVRTTSRGRCKLKGPEPE